MSEVTTTTTKKRKAGAPTGEEPQVIKKHKGEDDRLIVLFVQGLPTNNPRTSASSGLVVAFNNQQVAQVLFDYLFGGNPTDPSVDIKAAIENLLSNSIELDCTKKRAYLVSDGPPPIPRDSGETVLDARVKQHAMKVFVCKNFATSALYPEVAVVVDSSDQSAKSKLAKLEQDVIDSRPRSVIARGMEIREVNLTSPGFYKLADGGFYDYSRD